MGDNQFIIFNFQITQSGVTLKIFRERLKIITIGYFHKNKNSDSFDLFPKASKVLNSG